MHYTTKIQYIKHIRYEKSQVFQLLGTICLPSSATEMTATTSMTTALINCYMSTT